MNETSYYKFFFWNENKDISVITKYLLEFKLWIELVLSCVVVHPLLTLLQIIVLIVSCNFFCFCCVLLCFVVFCCVLLWSKRQLLLRHGVIQTTYTLQRLEMIISHVFYLPLKKSSSFLQSRPQIIVTFRSCLNKYLCNF